MATNDEIEWLKDDWQNDPSFNIEDAPGFEDHRDELRAWRLTFEADYEKLESQKLEARARENRRTIAKQEAIERAALDERRHRQAASRALQELFQAAGLRRSGPGPADLGDFINTLVDDLMRAAEARSHMTRLAEDD